MSDTTPATAQTTEQITILLPAGRLPHEILAAVHELAMEHHLELYLTTLQNLRLLNVPKEAFVEITERLASLGAQFKAPGRFPIPRICIGAPYCNLGLIDTKALSNRILARFAGREKTKAKLKIAVSGCVLSCSGARTSDIGIVATRNGFDVYIGGKGGQAPKTGIRIAKDATEEEMLITIATLIDFHHRKTATKQRMIKLLDAPDFPFLQR